MGQNRQFLAIVRFIFSRQMRHDSPKIGFFFRCAGPYKAYFRLHRRPSFQRNARRKPQKSSIFPPKMCFFSLGLRERSAKSNKWAISFHKGNPPNFTIVFQITPSNRLGGTFPHLFHFFYTLAHLTMNRTMRGGP